MLISPAPNVAIKHELKDFFSVVEDLLWKKKTNASNMFQHLAEQMLLHFYFQCITWSPSHMIRIQPLSTRVTLYTFFWISSLSWEVSTFYTLCLDKSANYNYSLCFTNAIQNGNTFFVDLIQFERTWAHQPPQAHFGRW